jgi:hypothetical protein
MQARRLGVSAWVAGLPRTVADSSNGRANASPVPRKKRRRSKAEIVCPSVLLAVDSVVVEDFGSMINAICVFCVVRRERILCTEIRCQLDPILNKRDRFCKLKLLRWPVHRPVYVHRQQFGRCLNDLQMSTVAPVQRLQVYRLMHA